MLYLEQFINDFYEQLQAIPQTIIQLRIQLKYELSQLRFQYSDLLDDQQKTQKKPSVPENILNNLFQNSQSKVIQKEQNELIYCNKLQDFIKKLKKPYVESLREKAHECLYQEIILIKELSKIIHKNSPIHEILYQIEQHLLNGLPLFQDKVLIKCPLKSCYTIEKEIAHQLSQDSELKKCLLNKGFSITRISSEKVFYYQRYLLSQILRSTIFNIQLPPGFVIRLSSFELNRKAYQYYFVSQSNLKYDTLNINKIEFAKHYLSLLCTDHLDFLVPQYFDNLIGQLGTENQETFTMYEQFKNPLLFYKEFTQNTKYNPSEFENVRPKEIFDMFLNFLTFLSQTQLNDFHYYQQDKTNKNRYKSLQFTLETMTLTYQRIKKLEDTLIFVQEVLFPKQLYVFLSQITEKLNQAYFYFQKLETSRFKSVIEYSEFINKINIEELTQKVLDDKTLAKYNNQIRPIKWDANKNSSGTNEQYYNYSSGPRHIILLGLQNLDLQYEINLTNRIKLLDYFAIKNFFYLESQFLSYSEQIYDQIIDKFNDSWFELEVWQQAFKANYSIESNSQFNNTFFVELLSVLFLKNKYTTLQLDHFQSIQDVEENESNCKTLGLYLMNKVLKNDVGFGQHITIIESALKYKKFYFVLKLLQSQEGKRIRNQYFNYLLDQKQNLFQYSQFYSNLEDIEIKYHSKIFDEIAKLHPSLEKRLRWDHFWNQQAKSFGGKQFHILQRGYWSLTEDQYQQIFENGILKSSDGLPIYFEIILNEIINQNSNRNYGVLNTKDQFFGKLLFLQPNYPLQKYMACMLYRLLQLDEFTSKVELVQTEQQTYSIYEIINSEENSQRIKMTIAQFLHHNNYDEKDLTNKIGQYNLANKILLSILLLPSNITPDQELLNPCGNYFAPVTTNFYFDPQYDSLINPSGFQRVGDKGKLACYNIYFLTQMMKEKIEIQYIQSFNNLLLTLQQWLKQLSQLETQVQQSKGLLLLPLNKESLIELVKRATLIGKIQQNMTYLDLLKLCDKNLGEFYQILIEAPQYNLIQKFQELKRLSINSDSLILSDFISFRESFAQTKYPTGFSVKTIIGPYKGLRMLLKYSRLMSNTDISLLSKKLQIVKKQSHLQMLLKALNFKQYKDSEVISILDTLKLYSQDFNKPFEFLNFKEIQLKSFPQLFVQLQLIRVKILNLSFVDSVTDSFLFEIASQCTELHVLNISGCINIHNIGQQQNLFNLGSQPQLIFSRLKTLIAQGLPNLKSVEISSQYLQNINFNQCTHLQTIYTNNTKLCKIQIKGCKSLQEEIVQLWILSGIRVLFDVYTANGVFRNYLTVEYIIDIDKEYNYEKTYLEIIFQLLGDVYEKLNSDLYYKNPYPQFFLKNSIIPNEFQNQFKGFLANKLDDINKKHCIMALFTCLFQNNEIKILDFKSLLKNRGQDRLKLLEFLLTDFLVSISQSILQDQSELHQQAESFFQKIEWIIIPCTKEIILEKVAKIIQQIQHYRAHLNVSFSNLKTIGSNSIEKFFKQIQRSDKPINISQVDFQGNSFEKNNLANIFQDNIFIQANIQHLILKNDGIDDQMLLDIAPYFWDCENLKSIDLSQNALTKVSLDKLLEMGNKIIKLPLITLNLSKNKIGDANFELIANIETLQWQNNQSQMLYLKTLILQNCFDESHNINSFCKFIEKTYILQTLDLRQNSFKKENIEILSKALGQNKSITTIFFQNNLINEPVLQSNELKKCERLQNLEYVFSNVSQYDQQIFSLFNLRSLDFTIHSINEQFIKSILSSLKTNLGLINFSLNVTDNVVKHRTFYKLGISQIKNLMEVKEQSSRESHFSETFFKSDSLRVDFQDYSQMGLSIDGGGLRGLMPATVINCLCSELKKEPYQIFDCIGGTSIGGILALSMVGTKDGVQPLCDKDTLIKFFLEDGKTIFDDQKRGVWNIINKSKYDSKGIEQVLQKYAGTAKLSETMKHTNVIVTAVKLQKEKGDSMAKVFSSRKAKLDLTENFLIKDVGRATSAAPTYFPAATIKSLAGKEYQFIDGGVGKNNPANLVLDDLRKGMLNKDQDNFFLLSISTGISKQRQHLQADEGILGVVRIIDAFGESNQDFVDLELQKNKGKYLRVVPEYDLPESQAQMDCTESAILKEYQSAGYQAMETLLNKEIYGHYQDKSFIRWLEENTARRLESLI